MKGADIRSFGQEVDNGGETMMSCLRCKAVSHLQDFQTESEIDGWDGWMDWMVNVVDTTYQVEIFNFQLIQCHSSFS